MQKKIDYRIILSFIIILLLPVYHNLYYADEFRFFSSVFEWPFLKYDSTGSVGINIFQIFNNLTHYVGLDFNYNHIDFIEEGFLMLIAFALTYLSLGNYLKNRSIKKWFYVTTLLTLIIPTLLLGTDYYPRFEFAVIYFTVVIFLQFKTIHSAGRPLYE